MRDLQLITALTLTVLLHCHPLTEASAADKPAESIVKQIGPYLTDPSIVVVRVRVAELPIERLTGQLGDLIPEAKPDLEHGLAAAKQLQAELLAAGAEEVYLVVSKERLPHRALTVIVPRTPQAKPEVIAQLLAAPPLMPADAVTLVRDDAVIVAMPNVDLDQLAARGAPHADLAAAFEAVADHVIQIVLIPSADDRRVITELFPTLPQELGGGPSSDVTRGVQWAALGLGKQETLELSLVVQSQDAASAAAVQGIWKQGLEFAVKFGSAPGASGDRLREMLPKLEKIQAALIPQVDGDRLTLRLSEKDQSVQSLLAALKPPLTEARTHARRMQSMNNLKQIALAMHNFYDSRKRFPAIGTFDAAGQPLLSWRVHLLPYLEHAELYQQFHLDEPWDSEHNQQLISKMPAVFACPPSKHKLTEGLATYRVVVGPGTAFPGREGIELKEITDGTSNTIMAVEVDDEHAVPWTKPEGLPFHEQQPIAGIGGQFHGGFHAASCDGAVHFIEQTIDANKLRLLLLRNDGNPVEW